MKRPGLHATPRYTYPIYRFFPTHQFVNIPPPRTVWATKVEIVLKNRASLVLLGHQFAKCVRIFLRHPPSKWKLTKWPFSPWKRDFFAPFPHFSPFRRGKTAVFPIFILRVGTNAVKRIAQISHNDILIELTMLYFLRLFPLLWPKRFGHPREPK